MKRHVIKVNYNHNKDKGDHWNISKEKENVSNKRVIFELSAWAIVIGAIIWWIVK
ncbi:hypothetical protein AB9M75_03810 [Lactobacillus sp. AN1001]